MTNATIQLRAMTMRVRRLRTAIAVSGGALDPIKLKTGFRLPSERDSPLSELYII